MKKRFWRFISVLAMLMLVCGCGGNVRGVDKCIGPSEIYTEREIESAMNTVVRHFRWNFEDCVLTEIRYDEAFSEKSSGEWAESCGAEQAIVLTSSFEVGSSGGDGGSLEPNSTYTGWQWILARNGHGRWKLITCGY